MEHIWAKEEFSKAKEQEKKDVNDLSRWLKLAARSSSIEEFEEKF